MGATKIEWCDKVLKNFWSKVHKTEGCWEWQAGLFQGNGYGQFRVGAAKMKAHRVAYIITTGEIPLGKILCHTCDNRKCVNPRHLILADSKFNANDRERKNRGTRGRKIPKPGTRGSKNHAAKLTEHLVVKILELRRRGYSYSTLATCFNVSKSAIAQIIRGEKWQDVPR